MFLGWVSTDCFNDEEVKTEFIWCARCGYFTPHSFAYTGFLHCHHCGNKHLQTTTKLLENRAMISKNIFSKLGTFAAECVQCYKDAYKFASGQWAIEEKQHDEMLYFNESKMIDNGFVSNKSRTKGLEAKLYKDAMSDKPVEDSIAALEVFSALLEAEERRERALARRTQRDRAKFLEAVCQIVVLTALTSLGLHFTDTSCFKLRRDSTYCHSIEQINQYFWGKSAKIPRIF